MIVIIDNYDSFTYNLVQMIRELSGQEPLVIRNDQVQNKIPADCTHIILSPGPGIPSKAGQMPEVIKTYAGKIPMLGVCLGHQAIGEYFGAQLRNLRQVYHGRKTSIKMTSENSTTLFKGLPSAFGVGRYHSWVVEKEGFPHDLKITAVDEDGAIMAFEHLHWPVFGVQFHPESIMTEYGKEIMNNFLKTVA